MNRTLHLLLLVALLLAACGGSAAEEELADAVATSAPEPTTAPEEPEPTAAPEEEPAAAPEEPDATAAPEETEPAEAPEAAAPAGDRPDIPVLRLAGGTDWGYPSPFGYSRGPGYIRATFIFDSLIWKDAEGDFIPWLAESWTSSDDGLTWTFTLREDARWHDGQPVTADDVVFSFNYQSTNSPGFPLAFTAEDATMTRTGSREVTLTLEQPFAPLLSNFAAAMLVIPQHIWEGVEDPQSMQGPDALIGSGPYTLEEYNPEDGSYLYVANEDFFLGPPAVKRIEILPVGDEVLAVAQGEIHAGGPGVQAGVTEDLLARFTEDPFATLTNPGEWTMLLKFNMNREPFDDVRFRQAVAYALDQEDMVERILLGQGVPGSGSWLSPANPWFNPDVMEYGHDPAAANALLDDMGLLDNDGDGIRELADGTPLSYELPYASFDSARNGELIQSYLADVGIDVTPLSVDRGTRDEQATEGNYDMILVGHGGLGGDPDFMRTIFHSQSQRRSFIRPHGFANDAFDMLAQQQLRAASDQERAEMVDEMQAILAEEVPVIALYYPTSYWFYDTAVLQGWHYTPGGIASGVPVTLDKYLFVAGEETVAGE